jgi:hypothetical protein
VYLPPEGFVPAKDAKSEVEGAQVWVHEPVDKKSEGVPVADRKTSATRIVLTHSNKEMSVEEADLAKLAAEMPKAFEGLCTWVHRRHEMRVRADGARVGLIEGDCDRDVDLSAFGLPSSPIKMRKLQLMFPDDSGTRIVTASYPTDQARRWEPLFEATIGTARGVATRTPAPTFWTRIAWAAAGGVLGWLAIAIVARKGSETEPRSAARDGRASRTKKDDEKDEDRD